MASTASTECSASAGWRPSTPRRTATRAASRSRCSTRRWPSTRNVRARFLREGYVANSVEHPGAVRILDDDTARGRLGLPRDGAARGRDARPALGAERASARARARSRGCSTRCSTCSRRRTRRASSTATSSPRTCFSRARGTVKVLDFGVARLIEAPVTATRPRRHRRDAGVHGARAGAGQDRRRPVGPLRGGRDGVHAALEARTSTTPRTQRR